MKFLHSMIRVSDPDATVAFFQLLGLEKRRQMDNEAGYAGGRNFGHLAFEVDDIYRACQRLAEAGVTINRPPRDGHMAFVRSPDGISIELLQEGEALPPAEPWVSMPNTGSW